MYSPAPGRPGSTCVMAPSRTGDVRRDRQPAAVAARPDISVAARSRRAVGERVARARVDDRDVAQQANVDVIRLQIADRDRSPGLLQEPGTVHERTIRVAAE